jgi:hypothetical protein
VRRWPRAKVAKGLRQILHELARNSQVRRFKSFREAAVYESEVMAGLIALSAFGELGCSTWMSGLTETKIASDSFEIECSPPGRSMPAV